MNISIKAISRSYLEKSSFSSAVGIVEDVKCRQEGK